MSIVGTFSIVAYDAASQAWGIAVTSRIVAVGAIVPFAAANAGAIATQSMPDINTGPMGLKMLAGGTSAQDTLDFLVGLKSAPQRITPQTYAEFFETEDLDHVRQIGVVDAQGNAAAYTGKDCNDWAGHIVGQGFCTQGNILAGEHVIEAVAESYSQSDESDFALRLLNALKAGYDAGGDKRYENPFNSAALLVARNAVRYYGITDQFISLRVDHSENPVDDLFPLREAHRALEVDPTA